jgi:PUA-domain protein
MSQKCRRYSLKTKEAKQILEQISEKLHLNLEDIIGAKANVETVETDFGEVLLIEGKPMLFKIGGEVSPTLLAKEILAKVPKVVVDMGAIPHVCNGADIMAPGIVRYEGEFQKDDFVLIIDVKHSKPLAIGKALYNAETAKSTKKGVVIKNIHYVSDAVWNFIKTLPE